MNDSAWESASIVTTSSIDDCPTPTISTMSDPIKDDDLSTLHFQTTEHHPKSGKTFIICETQKPHRVVSLYFGRLTLLDKRYAGVGYLWMCVKKAGWYGFQNVSSGTYLGHCQSQVRATQPHHKADEYFIAERHEDGGYVLLTKHGEELWQVAISKDGTSLVEVKPDQGTGTAWDFVGVGQLPDH
ncbi:hypothetical protein V8C42DRAFT_306785 [Trichoderma barbatum]